MAAPVPTAVERVGLEAIDRLGREWGRLTSPTPLFKVKSVGLLPTGSGRHDKGKNPANRSPLAHKGNPRMPLRASLASIVIACCVAAGGAVAPAGADHPNIVVILADDMGYGDVKCNYPDGKIPTPHLDRLASQGMRFTDAHAPSSLCTPTRYAVLTGQYAWRTRLKAGVLWEYDKPLIEERRLTLPAMLRQHGYRTAAVGKWHLGLNWPFASAESAKKIAKNRDSATCADIDWSKPISGGPTDRGFDYYFGVNVPNFSPYAFVKNDRLVGPAPTEQVPRIDGRLSQLPGPGQAGFNRKQVAPTLAKKACEWIEVSAKTGKPFFLYLALTGPHSPIIPNDEFKGKSGIGDYGDWVMEMDWTVGEVVAALTRAGVAENTLLIFTSDNGPEIWNYEEARDYKHYAMGPLRGVKQDTWEGGHRVPFIARWPGHVPADTTNAEVICHSDLMATTAAIVGATLPVNAGEDSYNILPALRGEKLAKPLREATVHHSGNGSLAIRQGNWVFIDAKSGGARKEPEWFKRERGYSDAPNKFPGVLYDLSQDLAERRNLYGEHPDVVERLKALLDKYRRDGRSTPGPTQQNDVAVSILADGTDRLSE
jgi:arylsulfatase A-like enzyme